MRLVEPGTSVGPYRVVRHIGSGGMGAVWLADDPRLHRKVALKTLRAADEEGSQGRARLLREARAVAALNHPNIATVFDVLEDEDDVVLVFEYVEGETLSERNRRGPMPVAEAVGIGCQMARALAAAHAQGVVHRDLKPGNVIVGPDGQVKVLDFGIARMLATGTTVTAAGHTTSGPGFMGTPGYAAPEQMVSSAVDERADLYALGVMLFEMVGGRRPFPGNDAVSLATAKLSSDAPPLSSIGPLVPAELEHLVAALLARDPAERPASAHEVLQRLDAVIGAPLGSVSAARALSRGVLMASAIVAILIVAGVATWRFLATPVARDSLATPAVVAVLPLTNMSGDPSRDYVAAGLSESLIASLAAAPSLTVLSRAAVVEARLRNPELSKMASELGASFMIEGSVQQSGDQLRVTVSLVRPDRSIAWANSFDGLFSRIFELQSRMAMSVSEAMSIRVSGPARPQVDRPPTSDPGALSSYWQARAYMDRRDVKGNLEAAAASLSDAIRLDPKFALAHAALGETYWRQYAETREPSWVRRAIDEGTTALRLDPDRPEVRLALAATLAGSGKADDAVDELKKALAVRPTYDDARRQLGQILARQGHVDEAIDEFQRAIALRPSYWGNYNDLGLALFNAARYQEAAQAFEKLVALQPDSYIGFQQLGTVYQMLGDDQRALSNYEKSIAVRPSNGAYINIGAFYHAKGEYEKAIDAYKKGIALRPNSASGYRNLGDAYAKLGKISDAREAYLTAANKAAEELKVDPRNARNTASLAVYLEKAGRSAEAAARLDEALALAPDDVQVLYRAAIVHALAGRDPTALAFLKRAVDSGYSRTAVAGDDDLAKYRALAPFREMVGVKVGPR